MNKIAPEGFMFVCVICRKTSKDKHGIIGKHSPMWDESCMMHSVLIAKPNGFEIGNKLTSKEARS